MISQSVRAGGTSQKLETLLAWSVMVDDGWCLHSPGVIHPNKTGPSLHHQRGPVGSVQLYRVVNASGSLPPTHWV